MLNRYNEMSKACKGQHAKFLCLQYLHSLFIFHRPSDFFQEIQHGKGQRRICRRRFLILRPVRRCNNFTSSEVSTIQSVINNDPFNSKIIQIIEEASLAGRIFSAFSLAFSDGQLAELMSEYFCCCLCTFLFQIDIGKSVINKRISGGIIIQNINHLRIPDTV